MLNKLRRKFVLVNMILVTLVLTIVFTAVLASSYHRLEMDGMQAMERVLRGGEAEGFPKREIGGKLPGGKDPLKRMTAAFYVTLASDGTIEEVAGETVTVTDEGALKAIVAARSRSKNPPALSGAKDCGFSFRATASPLRTGRMKLRA